MSKKKSDHSSGQGQVGVFTPPPLQADGRVAKQDEYAARIAETLPYWEFAFSGLPLFLLVPCL
jgi:hypothetical protein